MYFLALDSRDITFKHLWKYSLPDFVKCKIRKWNERADLFDVYCIYMHKKQWRLSLENRFHSIQRKFTISFVVDMDFPHLL